MGDRAAGRDETGVSETGVPKTDVPKTDVSTTDASESARSRRVAAEIAASLQAAGHVAYFAGGCVRDRLLGLEPKDHDVATDATPDQIRAVFPRAHGVGEAFGVMLVARDGVTIEVATFRSDGPYSDARRPDHVAFAGPEDDARRRDFTINGLFEDPRDGAVIDFVDGQADLRRAVVRAIGDPAERLAEDRLRALRAVRFATRFDFALDRATAAAIRRSAHDVAAVSRERIGLELRAMLAAPGRVRAIALLHELDLLAPIFEPAEHVPSVGGPRVRGLRGVVDPEIAMAAWILDDAAARGVHPEEAWHRAADIADRWRDALVLSNAETGRVRSALDADRGIHDWPSLRTAARKRLAATSGFVDARRIMAGARPAALARLDADVRVLAASGVDPAPVVTGDHLIAAGLQPGPRFGPALDAVRDAQLEGRLRGRRDGIAVARRVLESDGPS